MASQESSDFGYNPELLFLNWIVRLQMIIPVGFRKLNHNLRTTHHFTQNICLSIK